MICSLKPLLGNKGKKLENANVKRKNENFERKINKHNAVLQRADPGTKVTG